MDRVSAMDLKPTRDLVIPVAEARLLRDEIVKLLADRVEQHSLRATNVMQIEVTGGNFKQ